MKTKKSQIHIGCLAAVRIQTNNKKALPYLKVFTDIYSVVIKPVYQTVHNHFPELLKSSHVSAFSLSYNNLMAMLLFITLYDLKKF
jgi:hypothetical protein